MTMHPDPETSPGSLGVLAAALAKAQGAFPPIVRNKSVDTGKFKYKYAALDQVLEAVRPALSENGLAITQLLDGPDLVTLLIHESGALLSGRVALPRGDTVQQFGSSVTYFRRYALQAILGVATEDDDDGNNTGKIKPDKAEDGRGTVSPALTGPAFNPATAQDPGGLIGTAEIGKADADFQAHLTSTGHRLAFSLVEGSRRIKVEALDALALQVSEYREGIEGFRVTCWGRLRPETWTPKGTTKEIEYQVLTLSKLKVGPLELTGAPLPTEAESEPLFPEAVPA